MLSLCVEEITWVEHDKRVYSYCVGKSIDSKFPCWIMSHKYNFEMNDNDFTGQLRLIYHLHDSSANAVKSGGGRHGSGGWKYQL